MDSNVIKDAIKCIEEDVKVERAYTKDEAIDCLGGKWILDYGST